MDGRSLLVLQPALAFTGDLGLDLIAWNAIVEASADGVCFEEGPADLGRAVPAPNRKPMKRTVDNGELTRGSRTGNSWRRARRARSSTKDRSAKNKAFYAILSLAMAGWRLVSGTS
jgi:hypothetical protein